MSRSGSLAVAGALVACALGLACTVPAPAPKLPGTLVGSFSFSGTLLLPGQDAGAGIPQTTCLVGADGGSLNPALTLSFFAYLSEDADAGSVWWQLISNGSSGPIEDGGLDGGGFTVAVASCAPVAGCGCVGSADETLALWQALPDGGTPPSLQIPVLAFAGWIDDRLVADANPVCLDAGGSQATACSDDAGVGCGLDCDLVYTLGGTPGAPSF